MRGDAHVDATLVMKTKMGVKKQANLYSYQFIRKRANGYLKTKHFTSGD